ncbi:MAG: IS66 family insertion sequence element accessory protein TnpB [Rhodanobacteraceae bacterium]|nr:IS66 family insertion sequence element accessory protein TnpB [Rhodanobacteraceae bacterium]
MKTVHLCRAPVDFRRSVNGLSLLVEQALTLNPFSDQTLFVFVNRRRDRVKILYWERNGFCLWYKRLEVDRFYWLKPDESATAVVSSQELNWLLDGFDIWSRPPHRELSCASCG